MLILINNPVKILTTKLIKSVDLGKVLNCSDGTINDRCGFCCHTRIDGVCDKVLVIWSTNEIVAV